MEHGRLVEVVPAYEPFARELFAETGADVDFRLADLAADPDAVEPADLVVMNRVVCCTPDGPAAGRRRRRPHPSRARVQLSARAGGDQARLSAAESIFRLVGRRFRVFVHPRAELVGAATASGLRLVDEHDGIVWATAGFQRHK